MEVNGERVVTVTFRVRVDKREHLGRGEEEAVVGVTGSAPALGAWDIRRCVPLRKDPECPNTWIGSVLFPLSTSPVQYRYVILHCPTSSSHASLGEAARGCCLRHWEATPHPREVGLLEGHHSVVDIFGEDECTAVTNPNRWLGGVASPDSRLGGVDKGWLVDESELQVQLISSPHRHQHAIRLLDSSQPCSLLVEATSTSPSLPFPRPRVTTKVLSKQPLIKCEVLGEEKVRCPPEESGGPDILVCSTRAPSFSSVGLIFSLYSCDGEENLIGRASLLPEHFLSPDTTHGTSCLTIFSPDHLQPIGTLHLSYLLVNPVKGLCKASDPVATGPYLHSAQHPKTKIWRDYGRTLDVGHCGMGYSYRGLYLDENSTIEDREYERPDSIENTIQSFREAAQHGADYVEFDVQLTRDWVPVIYHDFKACASLQSLHGAPGLHKIFVKDLSLAEIRSYKLEHLSALKRKCDGGVTCSLPGGEGVVSAGRNGAPGAVELDWNKPFPTLEDVFNNVPDNLGFNIEVKYPVPEIYNDDVNFPYFDRNKMADTILLVVYKHARDRNIIFSCFDADMCTILRLKQPRFPVLFLTTNDSPEYLKNYSVDLKSQTIQDAILHAEAQDLLGIDIDSHQLLSEEGAGHQWVETAKERNLVLFTWGSKNIYKRNVERQKELKVDAIICDRIDLILDSRKKLKLDREEKLYPESENAGTLTMDALINPEV